MKRLAILLVALAFPAGTAAPVANDVLSIVSMPLATAAVSDLPGIPRDELENLADALNHADIAPAHFVTIMRYAPIALTTHTPSEPSFVEFVQAQSAQGVVGAALTANIERQLPSFGIAPRLISAPVPPPETVAEGRDFFPPEVQAHIARLTTTSAGETPDGAIGGNPYVTEPGFGRPTSVLRPMMSSVPSETQATAPTDTATATAPTTESTTSAQGKKGGPQ